MFRLVETAAAQYHLVLKAAPKATLHLPGFLFLLLPRHQPLPQLVLQQALKLLMQRYHTFDTKFAYPGTLFFELLKLCAANDSRERVPIQVQTQCLP